MKKILLPLAIALIFAGQSANAQSKESVKNTPAINMVFAAQASAENHHVSILDRMQQETEELILVIAPAPMVSIARLIDEKVKAGKEKKAKHSGKEKKNRSTCES